MLPAWVVTLAVFRILLAAHRDVSYMPDIAVWNKQIREYNNCQIISVPSGCPMKLKSCSNMALIWVRI